MRTQTKFFSASDVSRGRCRRHLVFLLSGLSSMFYETGVELHDTILGCDKTCCTTFPHRDNIMIEVDIRID